MHFLNKRQLYNTKPETLLADEKQSDGVDICPIVIPKNAIHFSVYPPPHKQIAFTPAVKSDIMFAIALN